MSVHNIRYCGNKRANWHEKSPVWGIGGRSSTQDYVMWFMCDAILKMQRSPGDEQVLPQQMLFPGVLNYD